MFVFLGDLLSLVVTVPSSKEDVQRLNTQGTSKLDVSNKARKALSWFASLKHCRLKSWQRLTLTGT